MSQKGWYFLQLLQLASCQRGPGVEETQCNHLWMRKVLSEVAFRSKKGKEEKPKPLVELEKVTHYTSTAELIEAVFGGFSMFIPWSAPLNQAD